MKRYFLLLLFPLALLGQVADELDSQRLTYGLYDSFTLNANTPTNTTGSELLGNVGFETAGGGGADVFGTWEEGGTGTISDETVIVHGGGHAAKMTQSTNLLLRQNTTVTANTRYRLTVWTCGDGTTAGRYLIYDVSNSTTIIPQTTTGIIGTNYTLFTKYITTPAGCTTVTIAFYPGATSGDVAYFDDASLMQMESFPSLFASPGPGKRTVTDTESKLSLEGGNLVFSGGKASPGAGDPGLWLNPPIQRLLGKTAIWNWYQNGSGVLWCGFDSNTAGTSDNGFIYTDGANVVISVSSNLIVGSVSTASSYKFAISLKASGCYYLMRSGVSSPVLLYNYTGFTGNSLYVSLPNYASSNSIRSILVPTERLQIRPIAYSVFTGADGTTLSTSDSVSADGYNLSPMAWNNTAWYVTNNCATVEPVVGSELVTNGTFDSDISGWTNNILETMEWSAGTLHIVETGTDYSSAYSGNTVVAGNMYVYSITSTKNSGGSILFQHGANQTIKGLSSSGTYTGTFRAAETGVMRIKVSAAAADWNFDNLSVKVASLTNLVETVSTDQTNVLISCNLTNVAGTQCGVVARWNPTTQSGVFGYHDGTTAKLETVTNGTNWTTVLSVTTTYSAGARIKMVIDGSTASLYYNEALITGSPASVTGPDGTQHGIFNTYSGNRCDNLEIHYRRHPAWTSYFDKWTKD